MSKVQSKPSPTAAHAPLDDLVDRIVASYHAEKRTQHLDASFLPNRAKTIEVIELMRRLIFPGFFDNKRLTSDTIHDHVADLLTSARDLLFEQVRQALRYEANRKGEPVSADDHRDDQAGRITAAFLEQVPELRRVLATDIHAVYGGDPAAVSTDEAIFCYPGLDAIFIYRVAHELHKLHVPLLPRIMTEYAHNETGIDIHPGAEIGESFFIDHGTGVVIGETTVIGDHVQIYQGVTLGALAPKDGDRWRGRKRHPTIEDHVTIYPNATILGGETVIGARCVINGSVFLFQSVPPDHTVRVDHPVPKLRARRNRQRNKSSEAPDGPSGDFQI